VARLCGEVLCGFLKESFSGISAPILIPIPLTRERRHERGFNQNELVIKETILADVGKNSDGSKNFSFSFDVLAKTRHTVPQSSVKNRAERLKNLSDCFSVPHSELVHGKNIILIDDVTTTGSTLAEARTVLLKAGAKSVRAVVIAH
jgi:ComF family protein